MRSWLQHARSSLHYAEAFIVVCTLSSSAEWAQQLQHHGLSCFRTWGNLSSLTRDQTHILWIAYALKSPIHPFNNNSVALSIFTRLYIDPQFILEHVYITPKRNLAHFGCLPPTPCPPATPNTHPSLGLGNHSYTIPVMVSRWAGFPDISVGKESACNAGDPSSIPGSGRAPEGKATLPTPVFLGFPCGSVGKEFAHNVGGLGSIPGLGRSPREGKGYPFQ